MISFHKLNADKLGRLIASDKVEITHTIEEGKGDYIINPYIYFDRSIVENNLFKTADLIEEDGKIKRVIYALNKDGVPFCNSYGILRPLIDHNYSSGRICIDCYNPIPPKKKNEYVGRLCCQECNKGKIRETIKKNRIKKIDFLG
jgi:hypothetical protein